MTLSRDQILEADDLDREQVDVPEWGGPVYVREMTAAERDAFEAEILDRKSDGEVEVDLQNIRARLLVRVLCDEDGDRLFDDADIEPLSRKSGAVMGRLFQVAQKLNGLTAQDIEEIAGN